MPTRARVYIALTITAGCVAFAMQIMRFASHDPQQFWLYFLVTVLTSGFKVRLPMVFATLSVNFLFILVGVAKFDLPEAIALGAAGTIIQCLWRPRVRPRSVQIAFSTCYIILATMAAQQMFHVWLNFAWLGPLHPLRLGIAAATYFIVNTGLVAGVIGLTEGKSIHKTWYGTYYWVFPYYMTAAAVAWLIVMLSELESWHSPLVLFPIVYFVYRSYRLYLDRLEKDKKHVEDMAGLHLRTIEALALAIEAKDATTHEHLQRVRVYALEIGKEVGMSPTDLDALQAAGLLHDIGKLAVPEHIISKPGRLTPEEFEKMKSEASAVNLVSLNKKWYETDSYKDVREVDVVEDIKCEDPTVGIQKIDVMRLVTKGLNRNERLIIILYYYEELTMKDIGNTLGLSESRVSQMHSSIVARLKEQLERRRPEFG